MFIYYVVVRIIHVLIKIIIDALSVPAFKTLTLNPAQMIHYKKLNNLIRISRSHSDFPEGALIRSTRISSIYADSSNCQNAIVLLNYEHRDDDGTIPETAFLKIPEKDLITRIFFNLIMSWELECQFYRQIASEIPIRIPKTYAVVNKRSRFALLLEDLNADPDVRLFSNKDMMAGLPVDSVKKILKTQARVHARFHGLSPQSREKLLSAGHHPFTSPVMKGLGGPIGTAAIRPCQKKAPHILKDEHVRLYQYSMKNWNRLIEWWYREPLTLIHGDSHLGNVFMSGEDMGMLDWQAAHWGKGIRDVQYFLINSLPADFLAVHEQELVDYYIDQLAELGLKQDRNELWDLYRSFTFQTWKTIIVSLGLGAMTEKEEVMVEILNRSTAAVVRVDFKNWLDEFLDGFQ